MSKTEHVSYHTIIFDLDGTLLDTLPDLWYSTNFALTRCGYPERTLDEVRRFVGNGVRNLIRRAVPKGTGEEELEECLSVFRSHYSEHLKDHTEPYPGIIRALTDLKASGRRIAVVSNKFDSAVKELCREYFGDLVEAAIGESPNVAKKPAPDSVLKAMELFGTDKSGTIYVGDSEVDAETADNAGLPCLGVSWGFRGRSVLEENNVDFIVDSPEEMYMFLANGKK